MAGEVTAPANELVDISKIIASLAPALFGSSSKSSSTNAATVDPAMLAQSNSLLQTLIGRGTTTAASDALVEDILHRAQLAFAPQLGAEKAAGVYNSTTKKLLGTEAIARATGAAANAVLDAQTAALAQATQLAGNAVNATRSTSSTGTNTTPPTVNPLLSGGILAGLAGNTIFNKFLKPKADTKQAPVSSVAKAAYDAADLEDADLGKILREAESIANGSSAGSTGSAGSSVGDSGIVPGAQVQELSGSAYDLSGLDAFTGVTDISNINADSENGGGNGGEGSVSQGAIDDALAGGEGFLPELAADQIPFAVDAASDAAMSAATVGEFGVDAGLEFGVEAGIEGAALSGVPVLGAINYISGGAITEGVGEFAQDFGELISDSVICTELRRQGLLAPATALDVAAFAKLHQLTKIGYWFWGKPYAKLMRTRYGSLFTALVKDSVIARTAHINGSWNLTGYLTCKVGEPLCYLLGKIITTAKETSWLKPLMQ